MFPVISTSPLCWRPTSHFYIVRCWYSNNTFLNCIPRAGQLNLENVCYFFNKMGNITKYRFILIIIYIYYLLAINLLDLIFTSRLVNVYIICIRNRNDNTFSIKLTGTSNKSAIYCNFRGTGPRTSSIFLKVFFFEQTDS